MSKTPGEIKYICTGTCQARISEEQYENGVVVCGAKDCNMKGQPFKKISRTGASK